ncbi:O-methylsterigmatocystin oxidoreductase [Dichomitus squalens]|uniref:O-methylsterigmatocystin oxidoreductase n=1 Tax=Dichomitus squalens TaxID=114155 RepID=A0A4Q9Q8X8_9APHY|nr:O-methylsterigmatocystin oxidoreductase [Dichomitus squalens]
MSQITYFALASTFISLIVVFYVRSSTQWRARTLGRPLPPGPKTLPILGNMFNMPRVRPWIVYRDLSHVLGDIIHLRVLGQHIVVLGSAQAIYDYLDKRSANTSDRVQSPMIELSGSSLNIALMPYGQWWRRHRRSLWQYFHREATEGYRKTQQSAAHIFLQELWERPSDLREAIRLNFTAVIMKIGYDIPVQSKDDPYVQITKDALEGPVEGMVPGRFLVDFLPFLRHVPPWFPFAASQRLWVKWQAAGERLKNTPFKEAKAKLARGETTHSIVANSLERLSNMGISSPEEEEIVKNVGAIVFEAGTDTVLSTMLSVFSGVSLHPEVLAKAHAELDEVVGPHRLPDFSDKDSLVYINAIIKEATRWHTAFPMGVPHATVADDEFRGYFIPAGTMVIPNTWACMHDPEVYEDPGVFRPERFIRNGKLDPTVQDPTDFVFGYGRRICPGRYFAESALFINVACAIHVFDITPPLGEDGLPIEVKQGHTGGLISYPEDVRCTIKPRSATAEALISSHATAARQALNGQEQVVLAPVC